MGKLLIILGLLLVVVGVLLAYQVKIPFLGRLPGDIYIQGKHGQFYFPIVTCLLLSVLISFLLYLFGGK